MGKKHDFRSTRPSPVGAAAPGKTRITIRLDDDVLRWFREQVHLEASAGYQTLINLALRDYIVREPLEATLRRVIREELASASDRPSPHGYEDERSRAAWVADAEDASAQYGSSSARQGRRGRARKD